MIKVFLNDDLLAKHLALQILKQLKRKNKLILGCPGGRSLKKTYFYIGRLSTKLNIGLNNLTIVMMDEYVDKKKGKYFLVNPKSHYSCVRFSQQVIKRLFNYKKNKKNELKKENILFPSIDCPDAYDKKINKIGGIDIFLLASGSSDGHVAFNNCHSNITEKTHIIKLSTKTRLDNMQTFSKFKKLSEVPKYGLTVGLNTISSLSKMGILVLTGKEKKYSYQRVKSLNKFDKNWPASIIYKCKIKKIYIDKIVQSK